MITGKARKHPNNFVNKNNFNVLTFSAIYGPNAGGKSNLIDAIRISQAMILKDLNDIRVYSRYNRNDTLNKTKYSNFEYEIALDKKVFVYGFSILLNQREIVKEYLLDITDEEQELVVFTRDQKNDTISVDVNYDYLALDDNTIKRIEVYKEDLQKSMLFLRALNSNNKKSLESAERESLITKKIYNWFEETLEVISPEDTTKLNLTYLNEKYLKELGNYLSAFDTGVKEVKFEKVSEDALQLPVEIREKLFEDILSKNEVSDDDKKTRVTKGAFIKAPHNMFRVLIEDGDIVIQEIRFVHNSSNITYSLEEESDGTKRIIDIFSILLDERRKVYVVDELDRSLHPNLSYKFVEEFINKNSEDQLIVTTHEEKLLDLNLLRRDQLWFVEKNQFGNSKLYSLEEYKERFDKDIQKQYLDGRYGSVPKLNFDFED